MGGTSADYGAVQQTGQNRRPRLTAAPAEKGGEVSTKTPPPSTCAGTGKIRSTGLTAKGVCLPCDSGPRYRKCRSGLPSWHAPALFPEQGEGADVRTAAPATRFSTARRVRPAFRSLGKRMSGKDPERRYEQKEAVRMLSDSLFFRSSREKGNAPSAAFRIPSCRTFPQLAERGGAPFRGEARRRCGERRLRTATCRCRSSQEYRR